MAIKNNSSKSSSKIAAKKTVTKKTSGRDKGASVSSLWHKFLLCCSLLLLVVLIGGFVWLLCLIPQELVYKNPRFKLYQIEVKNGYWQGRDFELIQRLGIPLAANVFTLDIGKIREKCLELGNVEDARVQLVLPDMLVFEFKERIPRAVIDGDMFIDEKCVKFKREESAEATYMLPEIIGDSSNQFAVSKAVELIMVATRECRDITVKQVDISNVNQLRVVLTSDLFGNERDLYVTFPVNRSFSVLFNELQNVIYAVHQNPDFDGEIDLLQGRAIYRVKN